MLGTLVLGLVVTAAFGLLVVGPFNPLSIAFAVLFIGLGIDFGIQYAVCFREQRHRLADQPLDAAPGGGRPRRGRAEGLALAALALRAGFLPFIRPATAAWPELGLIAAARMVIARAVSLTTLPALAALHPPQAEPDPVGYAALAPLDRLLARRAWAALLIATAVAVAACACLPLLRFDSNPLNLRDPATEGAATSAARPLRPFGGDGLVRPRRAGRGAGGDGHRGLRPGELEYHPLRLR